MVTVFSPPQQQSLPFFSAYRSRFISNVFVSTFRKKIQPLLLPFLLLCLSELTIKDKNEEKVKLLRNHLL